MRLVILLAVIGALVWLGTRAMHPVNGPGSAPAARQVVDGARQDLQRVEVQRQAALDRRLQDADRP